MRSLQIGDSIAYLSIKNRQLVAYPRSDEETAKQAPLEDLDAVVLETLNGLGLNLHVLQGFIENNTSLIICDKRHLPAGILLPLFGTLDHGAVLQGQIEISQPHKKQLWKQLIKEKLLHQAMNLKPDSYPRTRINDMASKIRSGDPDNFEAQGARIYWNAFVGSSFRREPRSGEGVNAALDYGYAVVRALLARAVVASGLHPSISVFHSPRANPLCLVDDLIEPLRPIVDRHIIRMIEPIDGKLTPANKREIVEILVLRVRCVDQASSLPVACERFADSYKRCVLGASNKLDIPTWLNEQ